MTDSWISSNVKSSLLCSNKVSGTSIEVTTKDGIVNLSGQVNNRSELVMAIKISQNEHGVKRVESKGLTFKGYPVSLIQEDGVILQMDSTQHRQDNLDE